MKEIEFKIKEHGVKTYLTDESKKNPFVTDIDIDDDVETILLGLNDNEKKFELKECQKVFPNVKTIILLPGVKTLNIRNKMFPNLRNIVSYSTKFETGNRLVMNDRGEKILLNSFCLTENESLNLNNINTVIDYALDGCMAKNIEYDKQYVLEFTHDAIKGSLYDEEPFVDGVKKYKNLIMAADDNATDIILHKGDIYANVFDKNKAYKSLCISDAIQLNIFYKRLSKHMDVEKLILALDDKHNHYDKIKSIVSDLGVKHIDIQKDMPGMISKDGILYSKDRESLLFIPYNRTGDIIIPEGVKQIMNQACHGLKANRIELPSSLITVGNEAFAHSHVKEIYFNETKSNVTFGKDVFYSSKELKSITMPSTTCIGNSLFKQCHNLSDVKLKEGLIKIQYAAFHECVSLKEIELPKSLQEIEYGNFPDVKKYIVNSDVLPKGLLTAYSLHKFNTNKDSHYTIINFKGNNIYIPHCISNNVIYEIQNAIDKNKCYKGFYKYGSDDFKFDTIIAEYLDYKDSETKTFIRKISKSIIKHYIIAKSSEEEYIKLVANDLLGKAALDIMAEFAEKNNMTALKAYLLDNTKNKAKSTFSL